MAFSLKRFFGKDEEDEFVEIDINTPQVEENKIRVKPFTLKQFDDINEILNAIRDGYTISIIDIKPLRTKDIVELKRAISKIKKTADAVEGQVAGFGENIVIATPKFAEIHKAPPASPKEDKVDFIH